MASKEDDVAITSLKVEEGSAWRLRVIQREDYFAGPVFAPFVKEGWTS